MGHESCFVAVHFGAGFHSASKELQYRKLMSLCCSETLKNLEFTDNLIESLVIGIKILEVCEKCIFLEINYVRTVVF